MTPSEAAEIIDAMVASMRKNGQQFQVRAISAGVMGISNGGGTGVAGYGGAGAPGVVGYAGGANVNIIGAEGAARAELEEVLKAIAGISEQLRSERPDQKSIMQILSSIPAWVPNVLTQVAITALKLSGHG